ncbi:MAG: EamA family transporter [Candidatus Nanoarchaeia archaeon]
MGICTFLTATAQYLWKTNSSFHNIQEFIFNPWIITGFIIYFLASILYIYALKNNQISIVFPMISISFIWATIISILLLNEKADFFNYLGIALIIIGVIVLGRGATDK